MADPTRLNKLVVNVGEQPQNAPMPEPEAEPAGFFVDEQGVPYDAGTGREIGGYAGNAIDRGMADVAGYKSLGRLQCAIAPTALANQREDFMRRQKDEAPRGNMMGRMLGAASIQAGAPAYAEPPPVKPRKGVVTGSRAAGMLGAPENYNESKPATIGKVKQVDASTGAEVPKESKPAAKPKKESNEELLKWAKGLKAELEAKKNVNPDVWDNRGQMYADQFASARDYQNMPTAPPGYGQQPDPPEPTSLQDFDQYAAAKLSTVRKSVAPVAAPRAEFEPRISVGKAVPVDTNKMAQIWSRASQNLATPEEMAEYREMAQNVGR